MLSNKRVTAELTILREQRLQQLRAAAALQQQAAAVQYGILHEVPHQQALVSFTMMNDLNIASCGPASPCIQASGLHIWAPGHDRSISHSLSSTWSSKHRVECRVRIGC